MSGWMRSGRIPMGRRSDRTTRGRPATERSRRVGLEPLETRRLLAVSATLDKGVLRITANADGDLAVLTAYPTAYGVQGTGLGPMTFAKAAVSAIQVADVAGGGKASHGAQSLHIGRVGAAVVAHGLSVEGIESTLLNANLQTATAATVAFKGPVRLPAAGTISIGLAPSSTLSFDSTVDGAATLNITAPSSVVTLAGKVGGTTPLSSLAFASAGVVTASSSIAIDGGGKTLNGLAFGRDVKAVLVNGAGSSVTSCTGAGIRITAGGLNSGWTRTVSGFTVTKCGVGIDFGYAPDQTSGKVGFHGWTVTSNAVSGNTTHGVRLGADAVGRSWTSAVVVSGNTVTRNGNDGIRVEGTPEGVAIQANTVTDNGRGVRDAAVRVVNGLGIQRKSVLIWNNTIGGADAAKLSAATGIAATNMPGLRVVGNKVTSLSRGLFLTGGFKRDDTLAVLTANVVDNVDIGISLTAATAVTADTGNTITRARRIGIIASGGCTGSVIKAVSIVATESTTPDGRTGVRLDAATGIAFDGLSIKGGYFGVYAVGNATDTRFISGKAEGAVVGTFLDGASPSSGNSYGVKGLLLNGFDMYDCKSSGFHAQGDCTGTRFFGSVTGGLHGISLKQAVGLRVEPVVFKSATGITIEGACTNTVVQNGWVSGCQRGAAVAASGVLVKNYTLTSNLFGLYIQGPGAGTRFEGCEFTKNTGAGVQISGATGVKFTGGLVADNGAGLTADGQCTGTEISGTSFTGNGKGQIVPTKTNSGIVLSAAKGIVIGGGVKSEANAVYGLYAEGDCTGTTVSDSVFATNGGSGAALSGVRGLALVANAVTGNTGNGLTIIGDSKSTTITGNDVSGNKQNGLVFSATTGLVVNGANKFNANGGNGVYGTGTCTGTVINGSNTITGNAFSGLVLVDAKAVSATKNTISGNKAYGLYATGVCTGTAVMDNTITGNTPNVFVNATGGAFQKL